MVPRHSHRASRPGRGGRVSMPILLTVVLVLGGVGGGAGWYAMRHRPDAAAAAVSDPASCPAGPTTLSVAAAPDLAGVLAPLLAPDPVPCVRAVLSQTDSADMAHFLAGTAKAPDLTAKPDVWIPDSSLWLDLARATDWGQASVPRTGSPVADSPTVVAAPKPVADLLRGGGTTGSTESTGATGSGGTTGGSGPGQAPTFSWEQLVKLALSQAQAQGSAGAAGQGGPLVAVADPAHDGSGLAAVIVLDRMLEQAVDDPQLKVGITGFVKGMANNMAPSLPELLTKLPQTAATAPGGAGVAAFPASEQKVWQYNSTKPKVPLAALYPSDGSASLDYPLTVLNGADNAHAMAADRLRGYLQTTAQDALRRHGFRSPDGAASTVLAADPELRGTLLQPVRNAGDGSAAHALALWDTLNKQTRMLAVVDVSGSMAQTVPGTGGQTRLQLTAGACEKAMALFGSRTAMGLWTFTTARSAPGATQITPLLPIAELGAADPAGGTHGEHLIAAYGALTDQPGSRNGLYDALLAAYQEVVKGWDPARVNTVVVFTDGKDDNLNSMSSEDLVGRLKAAGDPAKPVRVFVVALGADVDLTLLNKITAVTGGAAVHFGDLGQMTAAILGSTTTR
ncbi:MAG: solute-binding protein [Catenulispora sp.]|nr:solute-binding protein [Catenulispora sp.]